MQTSQEVDNSSPSSFKSKRIFTGEIFNLGRQPQELLPREPKFDMTNQQQPEFNSMMQQQQQIIPKAPPAPMGKVANAEKPVPREKKFKKDSYWKPLLRLFRRYMKKGALYKGAYRKIRSRPVEEHSRLFMIALELPKHIKRTKETEFAVLLLINSHSLTHRNKLTA